MATGRKYILNLNNVISCGLGTYTGESTQRNLLDSFTITCDTIPPITCSYPTLTTEDLQMLSNIDYDKRVIDFFDYIGLESGIQKEILFTGATINDLSCNEYFCYLNYDFLVYKFLSGVRIVNVGNANGVVQYLVSGGTYNSGWQNNPTFLNLDQNGVYNVFIRDYIASEDIIVCEYSKLISMPTVLQSTTVTIPSKIISISQTSEGDSGFAVYKTGCFKINPTALSAGQKVQIDYTAVATVFGCGSSCVRISCIPNGGNCCTYDILTNLNAAQPKNNSIILCYGDIVTYDLMSITNNYGSNANANFCFTSVNGLNTVNPIIDITNCSTSVTSCQSPLDVTVGVIRCTATYPSTYTYKLTGVIELTPPIPVGHCVDVTLSATTLASGGGSSNITFTCRAKGTLADICICSVMNAQPQPQQPVLRIKEGDIICYSTTMNALTIGSSASINFGIKDLTASYGVNPVRNSLNYGDSACNVRVATPITVSICPQYTSECCGHGFINTSVPIPVGECIRTCYIYDLDIPVGLIASACIIFSLCPYVGGTFSQICCVNSYFSPNTGVISIPICANQKLCYCLKMVHGICHLHPEFTLRSVGSSSGVIPSIDPAKNYVCL